MSTISLREERVFWQEAYLGRTFDFRSQLNFTRFDDCVFVDCILLLDEGTEQLSFTSCTFKDCNIDKIEDNVIRGILSENNTFHRPIAARKADFDKRLAEALQNQTRK
ncbi:hypothetical protein BN961_00344 [Afipia felis]|uniref:Uncharacterized protein n=1 Tax=Afipia felis TaxID=1035 RepID=A0A090N6J5_AFIFE|nr:hypothetical protein [Afipia felis]CEG06963.1 hypothetical protein BN961_00344 [Afipia felis]